MSLAIYRCTQPYPEKHPLKFSAEKAQEVACPVCTFVDYVAYVRDCGPKYGVKK